MWSKHGSSVLKGGFLEAVLSHLSYWFSSHSSCSFSCLRVFLQPSLLGSILQDRHDTTLLIHADNRDKASGWIPMLKSILELWEIWFSEAYKQERSQEFGVGLLHSSLIENEAVDGDAT